MITGGDRCLFISFHVATGKFWSLSRLGGTAGLFIAGRRVVDRLVRYRRVDDRPGAIVHCITCKVRFWFSGCLFV